MTDNEIIKALECCNKSDNGKGCFLCPYRQYCPDCLRRRNEDAIELTNRQKANAEGLTNAVKFLNEKVSSAKAEAVKEFAERLKDSLDDFYHTEEDALLETGDLIDNLVKEMSGDEA